MILLWPVHRIIGDLVHNYRFDISRLIVNLSTIFTTWAIKHVDVCQTRRRKNGDIVSSEHFQSIHLIIILIHVWTIFSIHPMTDWTQREREITQTMPLTDQSTVYKRMPFPHISSSSTINRTQSKLNFFSFFSWVGWVEWVFHFIE